MGAGQVMVLLCNHGSVCLRGSVSVSASVLESGWGQGQGQGQGLGYLVQGEAGLRHEDIIPLINECGDDEVQGATAATGDADVVLGVLRLSLATRVRRDGLPRRHGAHARDVAVRRALVQLLRYGVLKDLGGLGVATNAGKREKGRGRCASLVTGITMGSELGLCTYIGFLNGRHDTPSGCHAQWGRRVPD